MYRSIASLCLALSVGHPVLAADVDESRDFKDVRAFKFSYIATIERPPSDAESVRVWLPIPSTTKVQTIGNLTVDSPWPHEVVNEPIHGNRYIYIQAPSTARVTDDEAISISFTVDAVRRLHRGMEQSNVAARASDSQLAHYLKPSRFVKTDGPVAAEAARVAEGVSTPIEKAKRLYDHIVNTVVYDKSGDGWGRGDSFYACSVRQGNCTDFHSLFIGEARALNIPARFIMGFPIPTDSPSGKIGGYHCWGEFYVEGEGWLPIDASDAFKHPERKEFLFGNLDANRIAFTRGRDIVLKGMETEPLNYFIYPHVEVDGAVHDAVEHSFEYTDMESN